MVKIVKFGIFEKYFFSFLIITLIIYDLQKPTISQIKANDISFGPYFISFVARINIFWGRKLWNCLTFFDSDFSCGFYPCSSLSLSHSPFVYPIDRLADWLVNRPTCWLTDRPTNRPAGWPAGRCPGNPNVHTIIFVLFRFCIM